MKLGVREICDVVFRAKSHQMLGSREYFKNDPVLYFDSLKTSSLEGAATTVYATGGRGNPNLLAWEGERTMTFNMEDALISPQSFTILSGADLIDATEAAPIYVHSTMQVVVNADKKIVLKDDNGPVYASWNLDAIGTAGTKEASDLKHEGADIFCMVLNSSGDVAVEPCVPQSVEYTTEGTVITCAADGQEKYALKEGDVVLVDFYVMHTSGAMQIDITPDKFGGFYYVEASTLFRRESDGKDLPAEFIIPKAKVQSNFTFSMAATGDPSTFSFVMDAFPDYTKFNKTKKVLAALQVIGDESLGEVASEAVRQPCSGLVGG